MDIEKINDFIEAYSRAIQLSPEYTEVLKELLPKIIKKYSKILLCSFFHIISLGNFNVKKTHVINC